MSSSRKFVVFLIFLVTAALGIGAVFLSTVLKQPETDVPEIEAQKDTFSCNPGFIENFTDTSLSRWNIIQSSEDTTSIDIVDGHLSIDLSSEDVAGSAGIETKDGFDGDFSAEIKSLNSISFELDQLGLAEAKFEYYSDTPEGKITLFSISRQSRSVNGQLQDKIIAKIGDQSVEEVLNLNSQEEILLILAKEEGTAWVDYRIVGEEVTESDLVPLIAYPVDDPSTNSGGFRISVKKADVQDGLRARLDDFTFGCVVEGSVNVTPTQFIFDGDPTTQYPIASPSPLVTSIPKNDVTPSPTPSVVTTTQPTIATPSPMPTSPAVAGSISVELEESMVCDDDKTSATAAFSIKIINNSSTERVVTIKDYFGENFNDSFVQTLSITFGGTYSDFNNYITWNDINLPASSTISVNFEVIVPAESFGDIQHVISIFEGKSDNAITTETLTTSIGCLPSTAFVSDTTNRLLVAILCILIGTIIYQSGTYQDFGNYLWKTFNGTYSDEKERKKIEAKKKVYEEKMKISIKK